MKPFWALWEGSLQGPPARSLGGGRVALQQAAEARHLLVQGLARSFRRGPWAPFKGNIDIDTDIDMDIDMDIDTNIDMDIDMDTNMDMDMDINMAVSIDWGSFQKGFRTPLKGFGVDITQA